MHPAVSIACCCCCWHSLHLCHQMWVPQINQLVQLRQHTPSPSTCFDFFNESLSWGDHQQMEELWILGQRENTCQAGLFRPLSCTCSIYKTHITCKINISLQDKKIYISIYLFHYWQIWDWSTYPSGHCRAMPPSQRWQRYHIFTVIIGHGLLEQAVQ